MSIRTTTFRSPLRIRKHFIFLLAAGLCCLSCTAQIWQQVDLAQRQGNLQEAESLLVVYLSRHPEDAKVYFKLGEVYAELEQWDKMLAAFKKCVALDHLRRTEVDAALEYYWRLNFNEGAAAFRDQAYGRSVQAFTAATVIHPERALSQRMLGEAALAAGDTLTAIRALQQATALAPEAQRAHRILMSLYFQIRRFELALQKADWLLGFNPKDVEALRFRAFSLDRLDKVQHTTEAYNRLIEISSNPEDVEAFAAFRYRLGQYEEAIRLSRLAIQRGGDRIQNLEAIAQAMLMQQNFIDLLSVASELLAIDPENLTALKLKQIAHLTIGQGRQAFDTKLDYLHTVARRRLKQKNYPELLQTAEEIITLKNTDLEALEMKAAALDSLGRYAEAREARLIYLDVLAKKYWEERNFLMVIKTTAQTLAIDSTNYAAARWKENAHDSLGQAGLARQTRIDYLLAVARHHLRSRRFYDFLRTANEVLQLEPENLTALRYKWMAHDSMGQREQAIKAEIDYRFAQAEQAQKQRDDKRIIELMNRILDLDRLNRQAIDMKIAAHRRRGEERQAAQAEIEYLLAYADVLLRPSKGKRSIGESSRAEKILQAANRILELEPRNLDALDLRVRAFELMGDEATASDAHIARLMVIAENHQKNENYSGLLEVARHILVQRPGHLQALRMQYEALSRLNRQIEARDAELAYLLTYADTLYSRDNLRQLIDVCDHMLMFDPVNKKAVDYKIAAHKALQQQREVHETQIAYWLAEAQLRMRQKRYKEAHDMADSILTLRPTNLDALRLKMNAFFAQGTPQSIMKGDSLSQYIKQLELTKKR